MGPSRKYDSNFFVILTPPPPCQQLSAFQYPLPKKYICQHLSNWAPRPSFRSCMQQVFFFKKKTVDVFTLVHALFAILWKVQIKITSNRAKTCPPVFFCCFNIKKNADIIILETPTTLMSSNVSKCQPPPPLKSADVLYGWSLSPFFHVVILRVLSIRKLRAYLAKKSKN